ncbi:putative methyltransferase DDB_G0268948 [Haliotis rubra]|uniref:putative methyltransferase DDB_G0268948 n=1 Tax=Haliotis rubra TaxID=36100 RepID=UPI001EE62E52|nr:putative methyltransferase DDB_G0268948 [Haliotis rubra]
MITSSRLKDWCECISLLSHHLYRVCVSVQKTMSLRFFEGAKQAKIYAAVRPRYSDKVFDLIFKFCQGGSGKFKLAVDVACGTGHQSTLPLVGRFEKVIGLDVSEQQLKQAPKNVANLEFRQSTAEHLSFLDPNSVDLVTAASSFHWFNMPEFLTEVERVLSPGGCLAVYTYGWPSLRESGAKEILEKFISTYLAEFYHAGNLMSIGGYKDVKLPFKDSQRDTVTLEMDWTVEQLCDFFQSTSVWQKRLKVFPDCDSLNALEANLRRFYGWSSEDEHPRLTALFSVAILLGRKPLE